MASEGLAGLADAALVERVRNGDDEAFAEIVRRHDGRLRVLAHRLINDQASVDDVLQDTYIRAFRAFPRFRGDASLATWLHRIAHNACMDHLRRIRRTIAEVQPADDAPEPVWLGPDPGDVAASRSAVDQAIGRLTPNERDVVLLVCRDGLGHAEAAAVLRLPLGTVASRLSRARAGLRQAIQAA